MMFDLKHLDLEISMIRYSQDNQLRNWKIQFLQKNLWKDYFEEQHHNLQKSFEKVVGIKSLSFASKYNYHRLHLTHLDMLE